MDNLKIASLLEKVAAAYSVKNEKEFRFQIIAYERAAEAIKGADTEIKTLWEKGQLENFPGIGKSLAGYLDELFRTGKVKHFEEVVKSLPSEMFPLLEVPGIGPKTAHKLVKALKITKAAVLSLKKAAEQGKIAKIEGFGEESQQNILKNILTYNARRKKNRRLLLPIAETIAKDILLYLSRCPAISRCEVLGSLRRRVSTIGDVDIAAVSETPEATLGYFTRYPKAKRILTSGEKTSARIVLENGTQADLRVCSAKNFGSMLQYFTGNKEHNIRLREFALRKGLSLSEYGIKAQSSPAERDPALREKLPARGGSAFGGKVQSNPEQIASQFHGAGNSKFPAERDPASWGKIKNFEREEDFYHAVGLPWIPPELREDRGEIEAALNKKLPLLIEEKDLHGDLHIHSDFPIQPSHDEGVSSVEDLVKKAIELGYEYIGLSDHSPSVGKHTEREIDELINRRTRLIEQFNYSYEKYENKRVVKLLNMLEVDILADGKLGVSDKTLRKLDLVIASIHSGFLMSKDRATARVLKTLVNPYVNILGHPTGRLLEKREGYELDWEKIFEACLRYNKALELNACPQRLDLPETLVREAVKNGVKIVISSDAHEVSEMDLIEYGVTAARRGWMEKKDALNTLSLKELIGWFKKQ